MNKLVIFALILVLFSSCKQEKKPNVIFILTDQWRASALGYAGNDIVRTPELDKFAKEAVNFNNAVSVCPVCTPYRASLLTGRFPTSTGMFLNDVYLPSEELCMAEIYKEANYSTAYLGKWHLDGHGRKNNVAPERRQGFDFWKGSECDHNYPKEHYYANNDPEIKYWEGYSTFAIANEAKKYMQDNAQKEKPFLLFVSLATPHFPHQTAPKEYMEMYTPDKLKLSANVTDDMQEWALKELQGYYAHCTATDKAIGEIIDKTKELGIYDNSIIVFTSDHGEMMGAHGYRPFMKHQAYSESSEIPFLISYPNMEMAKGKKAEAPITTPDILPSLLSLCNIKIPKSIEGYDLSGIVKDPSKDIDRVALFMNPCPFDIAYDDDEYRAIKTARYTYAKTPDGPSMLFDNEKDPLQLNNLVGNEDYAEIQQELDKQLMNELSRIGETEVKPREYYLEKFGFDGKKEFRDDLAIQDYNDVDVVVSPNLIEK
nr:sulfatase [uncultured Draconibacterium sp.]